jgi:Ulp1 family protease
MLRSKLWTGLKDERIRNATRYKYEVISNFDTLRAELRAVEHEMKELDGVPRGKTSRVLPKAAVMQQVETHSRNVRSPNANSEPSQQRSIVELTKKVQSLEAKLKGLPDNTKMLNQILQKVEKLEKCQSQSTQQKEKETPKPSNSSRPLPRDR